MFIKHLLVSRSLFLRLCMCATRNLSFQCNSMQNWCMCDVLNAYIIHYEYESNFLAYVSPPLSLSLAFSLSPHTLVLPLPISIPSYSFSLPRSPTVYLSTLSPRGTLLLIFFLPAIIRRLLQSPRIVWISTNCSLRIVRVPRLRRGDLENLFQTVYFSCYHYGYLFCTADSILLRYVRLAQDRKLFRKPSSRSRQLKREQIPAN